MYALKSYHSIILPNILVIELVKHAKLIKVSLSGYNDETAGEITYFPVILTIRFGFCNISIDLSQKSE